MLKWKPLSVAMTMSKNVIDTLVFTFWGYSNNVKTTQFFYTTLSNQQNKHFYKI